MFMLLITSLFSICIASVLTYILSCRWMKFQILDHPNERSLHNKPTPRTGGFGLLAGIFSGICALIFIIDGRFELIWISGAVIVVGLVSFFDDRSHVSAQIRFIVHLVAAGAILTSSIGLQSISLPGLTIGLPSWVGLLISVLFIVWMINLYNFMDGMDGFAGGMAVIGFGTLGLLGLLGGDAYYASVCWVIAAASGGFLVWNFPPARIFMGDTGSSVLGLLAAALSLWADRAGLFPLWLSVLVFSPFVIDATLTLVRRTLRGERIWEAHRNHYYQRLVQAGWSHRRTVLWEYGLMFLNSVAALGAFHASTEIQWAIIGSMFLVYLAAIVGVRRMEMRRAVNSGSAASL